MLRWFGRRSVAELGKNAQVVLDVGLNNGKDTEFFLRQGHAVVAVDAVLAPPKVSFVTRIFHPNVLFKTGEICLDILKPESWTPAWTLQSVCRALVALLSHPEADSPLNCDCGNLIRNGDMRGYRSMARMYTTLHAVPLASRESRDSRGSLK